MRNSFDEAATGEIHEQALEFAESLARLKSLRWGFDRFKSPHAFDKDESPPILAVIGFVKRPAIVSRHDRERAARESVCAFICQFPAQMGGHPQQIFHHSSRVFEDVVIDALMDVAHLGAALIVGSGVGFVDMSYFAWLRMQDFSVDLELSGNFEEVDLFAAIHGNVDENRWPARVQACGLGDGSALGEEGGAGVFPGGFRCALK